MGNNLTPARPVATAILIVTAMLAAAPLLPVHAYERRLPPPIMALAEEEKDHTVYFTDTDVDWLRRCVKAEIGGGTLTEQSQVAWCVLNRLDAGGFGDSITDVVTAPRQFVYSKGTGSASEFDWIVRDVLTRWVGEKKGDSTPETSGRTLPPECLYFWGDGKHNHFRDKWKNGTEYDGSLGSPYEGD